MILSVAHQLMHALEAAAIMAFIAFCIDFRRELADLWASIKADSESTGNRFPDDDIKDFTFNREV